METNINNDNRIFQYTFAGAVLFIAALAFVLLNLVSAGTLALPYTIVAATLGISAVALLYKAIKDDNSRMRSA